MSLPDLIPSLRASLPPRLGAELWPVTTRRAALGAITIGGVDLADIAERYGTPAYVLDEDDVRAQCRWFAAAFDPSNVVYAAKALTCRAILRWIAEEGLGLSVYSEGQLAVAAAAGFPAGRMVLHGDGVPLPADLLPGDLLAAPGAGAYHLPLASNYNLVPRPPLVAVRDGRAQAVVRRETIDDVLERRRLSTREGESFGRPPRHRRGRAGTLRGRVARVARLHGRHCLGRHSRL